MGLIGDRFSPRKREIAMWKRCFVRSDYHARSPCLTGQKHPTRACAGRHLRASATRCQASAPGHTADSLQGRYFTYGEGTSQSTTSRGQALLLVVPKVWKGLIIPGR